MESRIKGRVLSIIVAVAMIASTSTALAATTKPTPKPTPKATAKSTKKASAKPATKKATPKSTKKTVTKKPTVKKTTARSTKKAVARKPAVKKRTVYKRQVVKVSPSPSPKWPAGLSQQNSTSEIYYRIPTNDELRGLVSADKLLSAQLTKCLPTKFACGVVRIASTTGCTWWEIDSTVFGPLSTTDTSMVPYGTLRTTAKGTDPKQIITVLLISAEPLKPKITVGGINISCHHSPVTEKIPTNVYTINTPSPSASPTTSPTTNTN